MNGGRAVLEGDDEIEGGGSMRAGSDFEHEMGLCPVRAFLDAHPACDFGIEMRLQVPSGVRCIVGCAPRCPPRRRARAR